MNSAGKDESAQSSNEFQSYEMDCLDFSYYNSYYKMSVDFCWHVNKFSCQNTWFLDTCKIEYGAKNQTNSPFNPFDSFFWTIDPEVDRETVVNKNYVAVFNVGMYIRFKIFSIGHGWKFPI